MSDDEWGRRAHIAAGLAEVCDRIRRACAACGRQDAVELIVVTKTFPASDVAILASLGVTDIGENRDQEARRKRDEVESMTPGPTAGATTSGATAARTRWHMIGQVQRNKAASIARWADVVESVDRPELVALLERAGGHRDAPLGVFVQISLDRERTAARAGAAPADAVALAQAVARTSTLELLGVMGVAPLSTDARQTDDAFGLLHKVSDEVRQRWPSAHRISAGMSGDLEVAIANGATQVRVGGAILGPRNTVQ